MDEAVSIGQALRNARETRGLELLQVREATRITTQNLEALEEDRFDAFPNRVYARAFLRDYANFLGLDSGSLLTRYEDEWGPKREPEPVTTPATAGAWRSLGYAVLLIVIVAVVGTGFFYIWWTGCEKRERAVGVTSTQRPPIPAPVLPSPEARPAPAPAPAPEPAQPPSPAVEPEKMTLEVTALRGVWVRVRCDGKKAYEGTMPKGTSRSFEASDKIEIRAGMAGAVQLKLNGRPEPPLGNTLKKPGGKTFLREPPASQPTAATRA